jgi:hypothetical protein
MLKALISQNFAPSSRASHENVKEKEKLFHISLFTALFADILVRKVGTISFSAGRPWTLVSILVLNCTGNSVPIRF